MLYPMNWSSLQVGTEPRAWIASTSNSRTFKSVFSRSESPTKVQPWKRLSRNRSSAHATNSSVAPRCQRDRRGPIRALARSRPGGALAGSVGAARSGEVSTEGGTFPRRSRSTAASAGVHSFISAIRSRACLRYRSRDPQTVGAGLPVCKNQARSSRRVERSGRTAAATFTQTQGCYRAEGRSARHRLADFWTFGTFGPGGYTRHTTSSASPLTRVASWYGG